MRNASLRRRGSGGGIVRAVDVEGHPRDAFRLVADALQIRHRLAEGENHAEILAHRLSQSEEVHDLLVGLDIEKVHDVVASHHVAGTLHIRLAQRHHRLRDLILDQTAHPQHDVVQVRELLVEALERVLFGAHRVGSCFGPGRRLSRSGP